MYIQKLGINNIDEIENLFFSVFTGEPWNDDWSDKKQLRSYMLDLIDCNTSLTFGLFENGELIGASLGHINHWCTGTQYKISEFFIKQDKQGGGKGTFFMKEIEKLLIEDDIHFIFLATGNDMPAYKFYLKNGFTELCSHVSFLKNF